MSGGEPAATPDAAQGVITQPVQESPVQEPPTSEPFVQEQAAAPGPTIETIPTADPYPEEMLRERLFNALDIVQQTKTFKENQEKALRLPSAIMLSQLLAGGEAHVTRPSRHMREILHALGFQADDTAISSVSGIGTVTPTEDGMIIKLDPQYSQALQEFNVKQQAETNTDYYQHLKDAESIGSEDVPGEATDTPGPAPTDITGTQEDTPSQVERYGDMAVVGEAERSKRKKEMSGNISDIEEIAGKIKEYYKDADVVDDREGDLGIYSISKTPDEVLADAAKMGLSKAEMKRLRTVADSQKGSNSLYLYNVAPSAMTIAAAQEIDPEKDYEIPVIGTVSGNALRLTLEAIGGGLLIGTVGGVFSSSGRKAQGMPEAVHPPDVPDNPNSPLFSIEQAVSMRETDPMKIQQESMRLQQEMEQVWDKNLTIVPFVNAEGAAGVAGSRVSDFTRDWSMSPLSQMAERNPKIKDLANERNEGMREFQSRVKTAEAKLHEIEKSTNKIDRNKIASVMIQVDKETTKIANNKALSEITKANLIEQVTSREAIRKRFGGDVRLTDLYFKGREMTDAMSEIQWLASMSSKAEIKIADMQKVLDTRPLRDAYAGQISYLKSQKPRLKKDATRAGKAEYKKAIDQYNIEMNAIRSLHDPLDKSIKAVENAIINIENSRSRHYIPRWDYVKDKSGGKYAVQFSPPKGEVLSDGSAFADEEPFRLYFKTEAERQKWLGENVNDDNREYFSTPANNDFIPRINNRYRMRELFYTAMSGQSTHEVKKVAHQLIAEMGDVPEYQTDVETLKQIIGIAEAKTGKALADAIEHVLENFGKGYDPTSTKRHDFSGYEPLKGKEWEFLTHNIQRQLSRSGRQIERSYMMGAAGRQMAEMSRDGMYGKYWQWLREFQKDILGANTPVNNEAIRTVEQMTGWLSSAETLGVLAFKLKSFLTNPIRAAAIATSHFNEVGGMSGIGNTMRTITDLTNSDSNLRMVIQKLEDANIFGHTSIDAYLRLRGASQFSKYALFTIHASEYLQRKLWGTLRAAHYLSEHPNDITGAVRETHNFINVFAGDFTSQIAKSRMERNLAKAGLRPFLALTAPTFNEYGYFNRVFAGAIRRGPEQVKSLMALLGFATVGWFFGGYKAIPWISDVVKGMSMVSDGLADKEGGSIVSPKATEEVEMKFRHWLRTEHNWTEDDINAITNSIKYGPFSEMTDRNFSTDNGVNQMFSPLVLETTISIWNAMGKLQSGQNMMANSMAVLRKLNPQMGQAYDAATQFAARKVLDKQGRPKYIIDRKGQKQTTPYSASDAVQQLVLGRSLGEYDAQNAQWENAVATVSDEQKKLFADRLANTAGLDMYKGGKKLNGNQVASLLEADAEELRYQVYRHFNSPDIQKAMESALKTLERNITKKEWQDALEHITEVSAKYDTKVEALKNRVVRHFETLSAGRALKAALGSKGIQVRMTGKFTSQNMADQALEAVKKSITAEYKKAMKEKS